MPSLNLPELSYLAASVLFIVGLKKLSSPSSARAGNLLAALGMGIAVVGTLLLPGVENWLLIALAVLIGTVPGWIMAKRVQMTSMPQMVSLFNGMGGACALLISIAELISPMPSGHSDGGINIPSTFELLAHAVPIYLGIIFGAISFTGSIVAFGKLQGLISEKPLRWPLQKLINVLILTSIAAVCAAPFATNFPDSITPAMFAGVLSALALVLGILQVLPIGGADMPVVISVLNSCTGMAAALTGFSMHNMSMIIAGTLVGAAGSLLTLLMCSAMNRSLANVLFGSFGGGGPVAGDGGAAVEGSMREISASEVAILMTYAQRVIVIPGYGLAVAQAQHLVHELEDLLEKKGVEVKYAIHPVAGRMPGHMNVLLAEANVPYPKLIDMEEINPEFNQTDVVLVIGANDVVNPSARNDKSSPIFGMPILDADQAKNIVVLKRGKGVGFAGIENNLFFDPKTKMLFGDAKSTLKNLVSEIKALK